MVFILHYKGKWESFVLAHIQHLQAQQQNPQNMEIEKKLRRQKEISEQMLNQKVFINFLFYIDFI